MQQDDGREGDLDGDQGEDGEEEIEDNYQEGIAGIKPTSVNAVPVNCKCLIRILFAAIVFKSGYPVDFTEKRLNLRLRYGFSLLLTL